MEDIENAIRVLSSKSEEVLDETVHDLKGMEAANINNSGKAAQIAYILGLPIEDVERELAR